MTKDIKARHWAMVVYPDSAPENWIEIISGTGLGIAISPLHDKDVNPDGEIKKSHYHVIMSWDGPVRITVPKRLTEEINASIPIKIESVKGYYRYFTHRDNPEKYQYDEKNIKLLNGFDVSEFLVLTKEEKYEAISNIKRLIHEKHVIEYIDLLDILEDSDYSLFKVACDNTLLVNSMIRSMRHKTIKPNFKD